MHLLLVSADNSIAHVYGGKHIHQNLLQKGLEQQQCKVTCVYPQEPLLKPDFFHKVKRRIGFLCLPSYRFTHTRQYLNAMQDQLRTRIAEQLQGIDCVSAQDVLSAKVAAEAMAATGVYRPILTTLHGYFSRELINYSNFNTSSLPAIKAFAQDIEHQGMIASNGILSVDHRIAEYVHENWPTKPVEIMFNAIDTERFQGVSKEKKNDLRSQHLPAHWKDQTLLLMTRRCVKKNGVIYAAEAFKQMPDSCCLLLAGDGPERPAIQALLKDTPASERVRFLGNISHEKILLYYHLSDILLMPSVPSDGIEEATSLSMLEGLSTGLFVIASAIGGMKEVIRHEQTGFLVPPAKPQAIVQQVKHILELSPEQKEKVQTAARQDMLHNHGYIEHARAFKGMCEQLQAEHTQR
jgi:glycosyltransferase involved in cell wall biosynthesis